uniref:Peptidase S1 domain-containing protein n=1 Tax=Anisakis simplex TaxID=6269 RepID=A0A0M3JTD2_ANISI
LCTSRVMTALCARKFEKCGESEFTRSLRNLNEYFNLEGNRLVGGNISVPHAWPWTVQILWRSGGHRCGGALISTKYIVTAAHCFSKSRNPSLYKVRLGGHKSGTGKLHNVSNITIHPLFNIVAPSAYDIAIVRIKPNAVLSKTVRTICLPILPVAENTICVVTGWGHQREGGSHSTYLREIHVPILSPFTCNDLQHYAGRLHIFSMFCAGYNKGGIDACQGDSGGPLMCHVNGRWELHGLVSWGNGCARPNSPGVYMRVTAAVPWINLHMLLFK